MHCIKTIFIGTDADQNYRAKFENTFLSIAKSISNTNGVISDINISQPMWSNDPAHLLKRARSRLVTKKVLYVSRYDQLENSPNALKITVQSLQDINSDLLSSWFKPNALNGMDDFYPYYIFCGKTLSNALKFDNRALILYLVPLVCINNILRNKNSNRREKLVLCYLSYFIMLFYYGWLKVQCDYTEKERKKENYSSIFTMNFCIDCCNYLSSVILSFQLIEDEFCLSRIGSILSEHNFAQLRYHAGKDQTILSIERSFNKVLISKKLEALSQK